MTQIYIAGLGVQTATQMTRQVRSAIRASNEVLYLDTGVATRACLETLCPRVTSLYERSYMEGGPRNDAYVHMAAVVLEAALDHPPVTFGIHGHPLIGVHAPFLVVQAARALEMQFEVLPGISALDAIAADLGFDPVVQGVQMYEATDVLLRRRPLYNDVPALLWQIGPLETFLHSSRISASERYSGLIAHLCRFYSPDHEVVAVYSSPHPLMAALMLRFPIRAMGDYAKHLHAGFSLFIPAEVSRPVQNLDLLRKLESTDHLRSITGES